MAEPGTNANHGTGAERGPSVAPPVGRPPGIELLAVGHDWARFGEVLDLSYAELYGPFGVARDAEWYHPAHGSEFAVALDGNGGIVGAARLLPSAGDPERQVRQVVVAPEARGLGVGRLLMQAVEGAARAEGAVELWLHARESAIGFYERLGYGCEGERFTSPLTGIPHRTMRKRLG